MAHCFESIISVENFLLAWQEFIRGKRGKPDVQEFQLRLMDNILTLRADLVSGRYRHGGYHHFKISDPKPRDIHKASVRDRLVHRALYRVLYPFFDRTFIADSYSCRVGKGTHKAMNRFRVFGYQVSRNHTRTCWVLKCDIRKFFASISHETLLQALCVHIADQKIVWLLREIIESFGTPERPNVGLPLGNLTSQLFVNIYMNEFDQFIKHELKIKHYIRYADDFVIFSESKERLTGLIPKIRDFLWEQLRLELHPDKVFIKTLASGVDFLGWVHFSDHRVLRTVTRRRMIKRITGQNTREIIASYLSLLKHGNTFKIRRDIMGTNDSYRGKKEGIGCVALGPRPAAGF